MAGSIILAILVLLSLAAPALTRWHVVHVPTEQMAGGLNEDGMPLGSGGKFLAGTDNLGAMC